MPLARGPERRWPTARRRDGEHRTSFELAALAGDPAFRRAPDPATSGKPHADVSERGTAPGCVAARGERPYVPLARASRVAAEGSSVEGEQHRKFFALASTADELAFAEGSSL